MKTIAVLYALCLAKIQAEKRIHTVFTQPIRLYQGEVSNIFHKLSIPKGPIAVSRIYAEIVEILPDGTIVPTPSYDAYLHHHVVGSKDEKYADQKDKWTPMKPKNIYRGIGFGAGTETRGTPQEFPYPYAFVTAKGEDEWVANVHIINTRGMKPAEAHKCLECPCTTSYYSSNGTFLGENIPELICNVQLTYEKNTACSMETYTGGLRCCQNKDFCISDHLESRLSTYYMKYTLDYDDIVSSTRPLSLAGCCDATGDLKHHGAVEYDIPLCDPLQNPGCTYTISTKQHLGLSISMFDFGTDFHGEDFEVELVSAVGHQHRAGVGIQLIDDKTDELICHSNPIYGTGNVAGNESGYIVSMTQCTFDPPRRMRTTDIVRIVATYDSTIAHTGAMSLWYLAVAPLITDECNDQLANVQESKNCNNSIHN